ncbi:hypothetical protein EK21DRAFT_119011 [Setomelanomma holmii]|uniref:Xylanolytic transcriptional activator regulatory domain-containing protein n=1 Tax=Setomelanomma holmii TaxID=210430 RepID=A0A9P4GWW4_9PLEO|nr:hypothetical protein EK21DRAFT_119011 [Setomelanomma holmii]
MVNAANDDVEDEQPLLVAVTSKLIDKELKKPQITTIQALLLLSVIHCSSSQDTKGWLLVGDACRLAIDFGLHGVDEQLASVKLSPTDVKVRNNTYLGCLVFDRLWALYLGRPFCLQCETSDLEGNFAPQIDEPWESQMSYSAFPVVRTTATSWLV